MITVDPTTVAPGGHLNVSLSGLNPKTKFALTTVDSAGVEVGKTTNVNRTRRDGSANVGVYAPPKLGPAKVRVYQGTAKVGEAPITVANPTQTGIRNVTVTTTPTGATIAWDVTPAATGQVRYGPTSAYGKTSALEASPLTHHVQQITGLVPDTTYHFAIESGGTSPDATFKTCWAP